MAKSRKPAQTHYRLAFAAEVAQLGEGEVEVILSTDTLARDGHIIEPAGGNLAEFLRNPIWLWTHDTDYPVGLASELRVEGTKIVARVTFAPLGVSAKADEIRGLVKAGIIRGVSIGFTVQRATPLDAKNPYGGQRISKWTLLEGSFVSIPADTAAGVSARAENPPADNPVAEVNGGATNNRAAFVAKLRGLYHVGWLAMLLDDLAWLEECVEYEAAIEEDGSLVPAQLEAAIKQLGQALVDMTAEEVAELFEEETGERSNGQRAVKALAKLIRGAPVVHQFPDDEKLTLNIVGDRELIQALLARSGRVLSSGNERSLREAHEHITRGCDMVRGVFEQCDPEEDADCDPDPDATERALRGRRARALKTKLEIAALAAA